MEAAQKNAEKKSRISRIPLIFDKNVIASLKGQKLQDQLDAFTVPEALFQHLKNPKLAFPTVLPNIKSLQWELVE